MSKIKYEDVPSELVKHVPEFEGAYADHITFYEEIIPYVLFGSLLAFFVEIYQASVGKTDQPENASDILLRLSAFLEHCSFAEDKEVVSLVVGGFLEGLNSAGSDTKPILDLLGPRTRELYEEMEAGWDDFIHRKNRGEI